MKKTILLMAALGLVALQACKEEDTPAANVVDSGTCGAQGSNLIWTLEGDGTLTISGRGTMEDYEITGLEGFGPDEDPSDYTKAPWADYREYISSVVIQEGVTSIGNRAFGGCGLTSVTISNTVMSIGKEAFYEAGLTSINIPPSVTSIGENAFMSSDLTSVALSEGLTNIGAGAFCYCSELASITIPESVTSIGEYAFNGCSSLTSVSIPESVTNIEAGVFIFCSGLTSVTIPEGVESIGSEAFRDCTSLTRIAVKAPIPPAIDSNEYSGSFGGVDTFVPVYVPASSVNAYRNSEWGQVFNNIQPISY